MAHVAILALPPALAADVTLEKWKLSGIGPGSALKITMLPDLDADGIRDIGFTVDVRGSQPRYNCVSGRTGETIHVLQVPRGRATCTPTILASEDGAMEWLYPVLEDHTRSGTYRGTSIGGSDQSIRRYPVGGGNARAVFIRNSATEALFDVLHGVTEGSVTATAERALACFSAADGTEAWRVEGLPQPSPRFGLIALSDQDSDGCEDILLGPISIEGMSSAFRDHSLYLISGLTGRVIRLLNQIPGGDATITLVSEAASLEAQHVAIGDPIAGRVTLMSLSSGLPARSIEGPSSETGFATSLVDLGDLDADGLTDLAIGSPGFRGSLLSSQDRMEGMPAGAVHIWFSRGPLERLENLPTKSGDRLGISMGLVTEDPPTIVIAAPGIGEIGCYEFQP